MSTQAGPRITYARYLKPDGSYELVTAGEIERSGNSDQYKGKTFCPDCDARVYFCSSTSTGGGGNLPGRRAHFKTHPGDLRIHELSGCKNAPASNKTGRSSYNGRLPLRFHINLVRFFNERANPPVRFNKITMRTETSPDIAALEPVSVKSAADFGIIFRNRDLPRIKNAVVVEGNHKLPFAEFFVNYSQRPEKLTHLRNLANRLFYGKNYPALLYKVHPDGKPGPVIVGGAETAMRINCKPVYLGDDPSGRPKLLHPVVQVVNNEANIRAGLYDAAAWEGNDACVLGSPTVEKTDDKPELRLVFNVYAPNAVARFDWDKIRAREHGNPQAPQPGNDLA